MLEGDCLSEDILREVKSVAKGLKVLVVLDSNHTHAHVVKELESYSKFVSVGSYIILPDTFIEYFPKGYYKDRPWDVGNNPMTALREFLSKHDEFVIDEKRSDKLMITEAFNGYLLRVK